MMDCGLTPRTLDALGAVFAHHAAVERVLLYGSRAMGTHRPSSDNDLAICGPAVTLPALWHIEAENDDLLLPYCVDLMAFEALRHQPLRDHIERVGGELYRKPLSAEMVPS